MIIAIDGPAGAGKSSVSQALAERLGFQLVDTGALYRCVGLVARRRGVALDNETALARIAADLDVRFEARDGRNHILLADEDVSTDIRTAEASDAASRVSALGSVRAALLDLQRKLGRERDSVMEGRDIGTVVFPDADVKVFLTASLRERARRRKGDYQDKGEDVAIEAVEKEIAERDYRDENRPVAPLKAADDAVQLDTTEMGFDAVLDELVSLVEARRS